MKKLVVTSITQVHAHTNTNTSHAVLLNGLRYSLMMPWPSSCVHVRRACHTSAMGMMYWMPVPAYEPVKLTKLVRLSVKYVTTMGGRMASSGKTRRRMQNPYSSIRLVPRKRVCKLLRSVMAIMGKLADNVKTGNIARKYSTNFRTTLSWLTFGTKFSVYRSFSVAKANEPVIARKT